ISSRQGVRTGRPAKGGSSARSPGTHRVLAVDATLAPRDPRAPGQFGHAVAVPEDKQEEAKSRWKEGNFNVYLSDLIPVDRAIADTRPAGCSEQQVHNDLPTTSIIMCFVDEVWSTLLRSVHSVLSRSPPHLIEEVILVDDFSTKDYLKEKLDKYMSQFPKVKILHLKERHGLIRARLAGAEIAKGDVLTFLDSHVECNVGWLEPLLERVHLSRAKVACPVIEVISDKDMSYMTVDNFQRGIFTWPMNFGWRQIPQEGKGSCVSRPADVRRRSSVRRCPVMAGGLFSIDKKYFFELGTYDPGLDVWGGENMEISFKVWMCGGEIEIIPCSRVGHIFRNDNPYSFPKDRIRTVERNLARVAEVWLDEYKDLFYGHAYHLILKNLDVGDLTQQIELRKKLQCKSFKWYLENVYPDLEAPLVKASGLNTRKTPYLIQLRILLERAILNLLWADKTLVTDQMCIYEPHQRL
uniref:Polypeptide N-acetylgalactosaminyltransferase 5 n=1 Tax=Apteryx owenii TaxID=8824 RepID=A0A8B9PRY1_APTOW